MSTAARIEWNTDSALHLLRRAAFGGTPEMAARLARMPQQDAVRSLLEETPPADPPPATNAGFRSEFREAQRMATRNDAGALMRRRELQQAERRSMEELRAWWLRRMTADRGAAREKLALFWHSHFATSITKVRSAHLMLLQNETLRNLAPAPLPDLLFAMASDPAMLVWLDGARSNASNPNENFAREFLELFSLGEGHYDEKDVREAARAFTGWVVPPEGSGARFVPRRHDSGRKTLLGKTGELDARGAVEIVCGQSRCAEFITRKLWEFYAYPSPEPPLVAELSALYRKDGLSTGKLLAAMFTHPAFYSPRARASQVKSPVQWVVQASRELNRQPLPPGVALPLLAELGQNLFAPPSVKGWDGGPAWINSGTLIRRSNTALLFTVAAPPLPDAAADDMDEAAWQTVAPPDARRTADELTHRLTSLLLAAPASHATRDRLARELSARHFPCDTQTVREAAKVLLSAPEYQLC